MIQDKANKQSNQNAHGETSTWLSEIRNAAWILPMFTQVIVPACIRTLTDMNYSIFLI
jgi:hypothetical protein